MVAGWLRRLEIRRCGDILYRMSAVAAELEKRLLELDEDSASRLERVVRDLIELSRAERRKPATDARGWPEGHFEKYAGSLAGEEFEAPEDPPPTPTEDEP